MGTVAADVQRERGPETPDDIAYLRFARDTNLRAVEALHLFPQATTCSTIR